MIVTYDGQEILNLSDTQKDVIKNDIPASIFDADMKRRLDYWANDRMFKKAALRLKEEWDDKLVANGVDQMPLDLEVYCQLVIDQPNYTGDTSPEVESIVMVDGVELGRLSPIKKIIVRNDPEIPGGADEAFKRELAWILTHKYERCFMRLKQAWDVVLEREGAQTVPTDRDAYTQLILQRPDYRDRETRDAADDAHFASLRGV